MLAIVQKLTNLRNVAVTDVAVFQNQLNVNTAAKMEMEMKLPQTKLQGDLYTYVLDHTLKLISTMTDLKEKIKTELLLELELEKFRMEKVINHRAP